MVDQLQGHDTKLSCHVAGVPLLWCLVSARSSVLPDPARSIVFAVLLVAAKSKQSATWMTVASLFVGWLQLMAFSLATARTWRASSSDIPEGEKSKSYNFHTI